MSSLFFSVQNKFSIKISSDKDIDFSNKAELFLKARVPGIMVLNSEPAQVDLLIEHHESSEKKLIQEDARCTIYDTWNGVLPDDALYLLYGMIRAHLLKMNLYPVHAICIGNEEYILVLGHTGVGKTSIALNLLQNKTMKLFSGDKTIVNFSEDGLFAVAGTYTMTIRSCDKDKLVRLGIKDEVTYGERLAFALEEDKYCSEKEVHIKAIVLARLNDHLPELKQETRLGALHKLYPYFLDVVNADIVLSTIDEVFTVNLPMGIQKRLVRSLKQLLETTPVYSLTGSSDFVSDQILQL